MFAASDIAAERYECSRTLAGATKENGHRCCLASFEPQEEGNREYQPNLLGTSLKPCESASYGGFGQVRDETGPRVARRAGRPWCCF